MRTVLPACLTAVLLLVLIGLGLAQPGRADEGPPQLRLVGAYVSDAGVGTEIISIQASTRRAAVTNSTGQVVEILSLEAPAAPTRLRKIKPPMRPGEALTSVAFHPRHDYILVAVEGAGAQAPGVVLVLSPTTGALLHRVPAGIGPDCVMISPDGAHALVANEAEEVWRTGGRFQSARGGLTLITLAADPTKIVGRTFELKDLTGVPGFVAAAHRRRIERAVDLNGDGRIEGEDEAEAQVPLTSNAPEWLEPEYVCFSPDSRRAFVTLQENNGVLIVDLDAGRVVKAVGLGTTRHAADTKDDGRVSFAQQLWALREPDGIACTPDGRYFVTADEGDTDPKASKTKSGPAGGGRTLSVFDAATGAFVGDTGNQLDAAAHRAGVYPDGRSDNKGAEPETVVTLRRGAVSYAVVGLERANAVALVSLASPQAPRVLGVTPLNRGDKGPEGLALLRDGNKTWLYSANEASGTIAVLVLE